MLSWRRTLVVGGCLVLASTAAWAQYAPQPYRAPPVAGPAPVQPAPPRPYAAPALPYAPPAYSVSRVRPTYASQSQTLSAALEAARGRDMEGSRFYQAALADPLARKIVDWALVDVFGEQLGLSALDESARSLAGWPRESARTEALTKARGGFTARSGPVPYLALGPSSGEDESPSARIYSGLRQRMNEHLRGGDPRSAYAVIANHGLPAGGSEYAEAESFAGWLALNKLRNPALADRHFAQLDAAVKSPVSKSRAAYWRGRAAEAAQDPVRARAFYEQGAQHTTTFYGQLAAERAGRPRLILTPDPVPSPADRAAVENGEVVRAMRLLASAGERSLVRVFGLHLGDAVPTAAQLAVAVDAVKAMGEQELSLLTYRRGAQRGLILHDRGYPVRNAPIMGVAEPALVLAITRQESQFDPRVRSSADARGMMQLLPGTAQETARRIGVGYDESRLWDPDYNMRLGSAYLSQVAERFSGSYIMAAAGYNAGPSRPDQWSEFCGDPRSPSTDPLDFIECIPFTETRNYVMRVMENMQVYRAKLSNGQAPLTAHADLKRGAYSYNRAAAPASPAGGYRVGGL